MQPNSRTRSGTSRVQQHKSIFHVVVIVRFPIQFKSVENEIACSCNICIVHTTITLHGTIESHLLGINLVRHKSPISCWNDGKHIMRIIIIVLCVMYCTRTRCCYCFGSVVLPYFAYFYSFEYAWDRYFYRCGNGCEMHFQVTSTIHSDIVIENCCNKLSRLPNASEWTRSNQSGNRASMHFYEQRILFTSLLFCFVLLA